MRSWLLASVCILGVSYIGYLGGEGWFTAYEYFTATCLFGIFLNSAESW